MGARAKNCLAAAVLVAAVAALYAVTLDFGFVRFDDADYTFGCAFVRRGLTAEGIGEAFRNARHGGIWMPLTYLSYMADISLFGPGPFGHHLGNLLWHLVNCGLLLWLMRTCTTPTSISLHKSQISDLKFSPSPLHLFLSLSILLLWALHPQRAEAVCWIAARKELVWSAMALAGLVCWARGRFAAAVPFAMLAAMGKPTAMAFPALAFAVDLFLQRRPRLGWYLPLVGVSFATGALAIYSQTHPEAMAVKELFYAPFGDRVLNAAVAVGLALMQAVVPVGIHFDYRAVPDALPRDATLGLAVFFVAAALFVEAVLRARQKSAFARSSLVLSAAVVWFMAALLPTLGVFGSFGEHARADRFLYVPMMAVPLGLAAAGEWLSSARWRWRAAVAVFSLLPVGCALAAWPVIVSYRSDETLFARTLAADPDHGRALAHLGEARCAAGALDEGVALLRRSRAVRPRVETDGKLAYALMRRGRTEDFEEIRRVGAAVAADPALDGKGQALEALGTAALVRGENAAAAKFLSASVLAPARFYSPEDARLKLGFALHNLGKRDEAMKLFEAAAKSPRADLSRRAVETIELLADSPKAVLFW